MTSECRFSSCCLRTLCTIQVTNVFVGKTRRPTETKSHTNDTSFLLLSFGSSLSFFNGHSLKHDWALLKSGFAFRERVISSF
jgi:hypothetical protein